MKDRVLGFLNVGARYVITFFILVFALRILTPLHVIGYLNRIWKFIFTCRKKQILHYNENNVDFFLSLSSLSPSVFSFFNDDKAKDK